MSGQNSAGKAIPTLSNGAKDQVPLVLFPTSVYNLTSLFKVTPGFI